MPHCFSIYLWKILLEELSIIIISFQAVCCKLVRWISWLSNEKSVFLLKVLHEIVTWKTSDLTFTRMQLPGVPISGTLLDIQKRPHFQASFSHNGSHHLQKGSSKTPPAPLSCWKRGLGFSLHPSLSPWGRFQYQNLGIFTQRKDSTCQISPLLL